MIERDLIIYSAPQVRINSVKLLQVIIEAKSGIPIKKLFSPLLTLSADHDQAVRLVSIPGFGDIARVTSEPEVLEMVIAQMQSFLQSNSYAVVQKVLETFVRIIPVAEPSFRDTCTSSFFLFSS